MSKIEIKNTSRVIQDSAWPSVEDALKERMDALKDKPGKEAEYKLCLERYTGLTINDVTIEPVKTLPTGVRLACITSRKTGFVKVDLEIKQKSAGEILSRTGKTLHTFDKKSDLQNFIATIPAAVDIAYVKENDTWYGFIPGGDITTELESYVGNVFFNKGETAPNEATPVLEDGHYVLTLTDPAVAQNKGEVRLFDLTKIADEHTPRPTITPLAKYLVNETKEGGYAFPFQAVDPKNKKIKSIAIKEITWPDGVFSKAPVSSIEHTDVGTGLIGIVRLPTKYTADQQDLTVTVVVEVTNVDNEVSVSHPVGFNFSIVLDESRVLCNAHTLDQFHPLEGGKTGMVAGWEFKDSYTTPPSDCSIDVTDLDVAGYKDAKYLTTEANQVKYQVNRVYFDWDKGYVTLGKRRQIFEYHTGCLEIDFAISVRDPVKIDHANSSLEHGVKATGVANLILQNSNITVVDFQGSAPEILGPQENTYTPGQYDHKNNKVSFSFYPIPPQGAVQDYVAPWSMEGVFTLSSEGKEFKSQLKVTGHLTTVSGVWEFNVPGLTTAGELEFTVPLGLDGKTLYMGDYAIHHPTDGAVTFAWPAPTDPLPPYDVDGKQMPACQVGVMQDGRGDVDPDTWLNKSRQVTGTISNLTNGVFTVSRAVTALGIRAPGHGWFVDFYLKDDRLVADVKPPLDWGKWPQIQNLTFSGLTGTTGGDIQLDKFFPVNPPVITWGDNQYIWAGENNVPLTGKWEIGDPAFIAKVGEVVVVKAQENILLSQYPAGAVYANSIHFDNNQMNFLLGWEDAFRTPQPGWTAYDTVIDDVLFDVQTRFASGLTDAPFNNIVEMNQESFGASPYTSHKVMLKYPHPTVEGNPYVSLVLPKFSLPLVKIKYDSAGVDPALGAFAKFHLSGLNEMNRKKDFLTVKATHANYFGALMKDDEVTVYYTPVDQQVPSLSPTLPGFVLNESSEREIAGTKYGIVGWYGFAPEQLWHSPAFPGGTSELVISEVVQQDTDCTITAIGQLLGPQGLSVYHSSSVEKITKLTLDGVDYTANAIDIGVTNPENGEFEIKISNVQAGLALKNVELGLSLNTGKWADGYKSFPVTASKVL